MCRQSHCESRCNVCTVRDVGNMEDICKPAVESCAEDKSASKFDRRKFEAEAAFQLPTLTV